jgi:hypothetical protein
LRRWIWCVRIEGEGFCPGREKEIETRAHPANPENIKSEMESLLEQAVAIGMHKILEGEDEAKASGDEKDSADEVCRSLRGAASHHIEGGDEGQLEKGEDSEGQPEDTKPVIFMIGGGDPDLADRGDLGDQIGLVPAEQELCEDEDKEATIGA